MQSNKACIQKLYTALQNLDAETMLSCYHPEATFKDPVFELSSKDEIRAMWTMLCEGAQDFELMFEVLETTKDSGSARVEAQYLFSATDRKVHNVIEARFRFKDGLIIRHRDHFSFYRWSRQALGLPGYLLGWTSILQHKVQQRARKSLDRFNKKMRVQD